MIPPISQVNSPVAGSLAQALSLAGPVITYSSRPASHIAGSGSRHESQSLRLRGAIHAIGGDPTASDMRQRTTLRMTVGIRGNRERGGDYRDSGVTVVMPAWGVRA